MRPGHSPRRRANRVAGVPVEEDPTDSEMAGDDVDMDVDNRVPQTPDDNREPQTPPSPTATAATAKYPSSGTLQASTRRRLKLKLNRVQTNERTIENKRNKLAVGAGGSRVRIFSQQFPKDGPLY